MDSDPDKWLFDRVSRNLIQLHSIEEVLYTGRTEFQSVEIIRSGSFGKLLVLDGKIQSSEVKPYLTRGLRSGGEKRWAGRVDG